MRDFSVPDHYAARGIQFGRHGITHAEVVTEDRKSSLSGISLHYDIVQETGGAGIDTECLDLKDDLYQAVDHGKNDVEDRDP